MNISQHVGRNDTSNIELRSLFSVENLLKISHIITERLRDLVPEGLIVPIDMICNVLKALYDAYRPPMGNPMTLYNVVSDDVCLDLNNQTINIITRQIRDEMIADQNAKKLTIWTTVLGDQNEHGLRAHSSIKLKQRRPTPMLFNMPL
jgi:hypothetical protein